jgi:hypothetical protein
LLEQQLDILKDISKRKHIHFKKKKINALIQYFFCLFPAIKDIEKQKYHVKNQNFKTNNKNKMKTRCYD